MSVVGSIQKFIRGGLQALRAVEPIEGTQRPLAVASSLRRYRILDIEELAVRPIEGSLDVAYDLLEMRVWSRETRHSLSFIGRDVFSERFGRTGSWRVGPSVESGNPVHPDVEAIARDLCARRIDNQYVIGGDRLFKAVFDFLSTGDSWMEFEIDREGFGKNDFCLTRSLYLPPLTMFIDQEDDGKLNSYWQKQQLHGNDGDRSIQPWKTLHFSHENQGLYGTPITLGSVEPWRKLKKASIDLEEAARNTGVAPWLHIMPEDKSEKYKETYRQEYLSNQNEGVVTDLFLLNGADVKKASNTPGSLNSMIDYWMQCRYEMVIPGVPLWFFPGLGQEQKTGKELANQPALVYARLISSIRAMLSCQIKRAIDIEVMLRMGYDFMMAHRDYDILWPEWMIMPVTENQLPANTDGEPGVPTLDEQNSLSLTPVSSAIERGWLDSKKHSTGLMDRASHLARHYSSEDYAEADFLLSQMKLEGLYHAGLEALVEAEQNPPILNLR